MSESGRTAFKYLSSLTEEGYSFFCHAGRLAVEKSGTFHGATYNVMLVADPLEYFLGEEHHQVSRDTLLDSAPVPEEALKAMEITLRTLSGGEGKLLVAAFEAGWDFPDDGLISFRRTEPTETEGLDAFIWLDSRDRIRYKLGGKETDRDEVLGWLEFQGEHAVKGLTVIELFLRWLIAGTPYNDLLRGH